MNIPELPFLTGQRNPILRAAWPEFGPLANALSDRQPTDFEARLVDAAIGDGPMPSMHDLRLLRAGHAAGRASVPRRPPRVYRAGDPPPDRPVWLLDLEGEMNPPDVPDPEGHLWFNKMVEAYGPLVEVDIDYDAALATDQKRRNEPPPESGHDDDSERLDVLARSITETVTASGYPIDVAEDAIRLILPRFLSAISPPNTETDDNG